MPLPSPIFLMYLSISTVVLSVVGWRWHIAAKKAERADDRFK